MASAIDISGLDKARLLVKLHEYGRSLLFEMFPTMSEEKLYIAAQQQLEKNPNIDYFEGCAIKTNLGADVVDPYLYDRVAGWGTFARAVASMREQK